MAINLYPGSSRVLSATFTVDGVETNGSGVSLTVRDPDGIDTVYTTSGSMTNPSTGVYEQSITFDMEGPWHWRWESTSLVIAADEGQVNVTESVFV